MLKSLIYLSKFSKKKILDFKLFSIIVLNSIQLNLNYRYLNINKSAAARIPNHLTKQIFFFFSRKMNVFNWISLLAEGANRTERALRTCYSCEGESCSRTTTQHQIVSCYDDCVAIFTGCNKRYFIFHIILIKINTPIPSAVQITHFPSKYNETENTIISCQFTSYYNTPITSLIVWLILVKVVKKACYTQLTDEEKSQCDSTSEYSCYKCTDSNCNQWGRVDHKCLVCSSATDKNCLDSPSAVEETRCPAAPTEDVLCYVKVVVSIHIFTSFLPSSLFILLLYYSVHLDLFVVFFVFVVVVVVVFFVECVLLLQCWLWHLAMCKHNLLFFK